MYDPLPERSLSAYPLSVGTSLAFESLFPTTNPSIDPDRVIPNKVNMTEYQELWINVGTLTRNMIGSLSKEGALRVTSPQLTSALLMEIDVITSICKNEGGSRVKPIFYVSNYVKVQKKASQYVKLRTDDTPIQKIYHALYEQAIKGVFKETGPTTQMRIFDSDIGVTPIDSKDYVSTKTKAVIMTHIAWDLTSHKHFDKLDLIESHTGVLKPRQTWYTKYQGGKELPMIPFMSGFLCVFGDSEHFRPIDIRLRRDLVELANECKWTQVTTKDKIKLNLGFMKNKFFAEIVKSVL